MSFEESGSNMEFTKKYLSFRILVVMAFVLMSWSATGCSSSDDVEDGADIGVGSDVEVDGDVHLDVGYHDVDPEDACDDVDCEGGEVCYRGVCYDSCDSEADCGDEERCHGEDKRCAPLDCEGVQCGGAESCYRGVCYSYCEDDAECGEEFVCTEGACVSPCEEIECEEGGHCYRGVCYPGCDVQADCDGEERCVDESCLPLDCSNVECRSDEACFYGVCYSHCEDAADCLEPDALCEENSCVVPSCDDGLHNGLETDVDCGGPECVGCDVGERCEIDEDCLSQHCEGEICVGNACGGSQALDAVPGESCGPCELDIYECEGEESVICSGDTACDDVLSHSVEVTNIGEDSASFQGEIVSLPSTALMGLSSMAISDHGFCWDTDSQPADDDDHCTSMGGIEEAGIFSMSVDNLAAGTQYHVQAFVAFADTRITSDETAFSTDEPPPPEPTIPTVSASDDLDDRVAISWNAITGADGYVVYRDGTEVANLDAGTTSFEDFEADDPPAPHAPEITDVSDELSEGIEIGWNEANSEPGALHSYEVTVIDGASESSPGTDSGRKAALPIAEYQICIGGDCDDADWVQVDTTGGLSHLDDAAPMATIEGGTASASEGEYEPFVRLVAEGWQIEDADEQVYQIRAVTDVGAGQPSAEGDGWGRRDAGPLNYEWFGSALDSSGNFSSIHGPASDADSHDDEEAPADGTQRQYYVRLSAAGASALEYPDPDFPLIGFRFTDADLVTLSARNIESNAATLRGRIDSYGSPPAVEAGLCWNTEEPAEDGTCEAVEPLVDEGEMMELDVSLAAGREYFLRVYAEDGDGLRSYGSHRSFYTLPSAPTGVTGTPGAVGEVDVQWDTPTYSGASSITGYTVTAEPGGETCSTTGGHGDTSCTVGGLSGGEEYIFTVVATNTTGDSEPSEPSEPVTAIAPCPAEVFAGGDGSDATPYQIETASQLNTIGTFVDCLDKDFVVTADINMDSIDEFNIIGDVESTSDTENAFKGSFDGGGHVIENLTIDRTDAEDGEDDFVALIGLFDGGDDGEIKNVGLENVDVTGSWYVAGLVGRAVSGKISGSYVTGSANGSGRFVGGLVAVNDIEISTSYAMSSVAGTNEYAGGLVGWNLGKITSSYATGPVAGSGDLVAGLAGRASGEITKSFWDEETSEQSDGVGDGSFSVDVTGLETADFGIQAHFSDADWDFDDPGTWTIRTAPDGFERPIHQWQIVDGCNPHAAPFGGGDGSDATPHLICRPEHLNAVGDDDSHGDCQDGDCLDDHFRVVTDINMVSIDDFNIIGDIESLDDTENGFKGSFDGGGHVIENLTIDRADEDFVALIGHFHGEGEAAIKDVGLENVDVKGRDRVGGLVGYYYGEWSDGGEVTSSYVTGSVEGSGDRVGGLVGYVRFGTISDSYATSSVVGSGDRIGGLVGMSFWTPISSSYATGSVVGSGQVGGLVGVHLGHGVLGDCYALGSVDGDSQVGGLVGVNANAQGEGRIGNCYSAGRVDEAGNATEVGGLIGENAESFVRDSFWDEETSGQSAGVGANSGTVENLEGLNTDQFDVQANFDDADWDFEDIWEIGTIPGDVDPSEEDTERPILQWQGD